VRRTLLVLGVILAGLATANCKSTKLVASWKNPNYTAQHHKRILVIGVSPIPSTRADFEDALSAKLATEHIEAIPGNSILLRPDATALDLDYLRAQIREHKIDAVVVSRLVKVETSVTYIPGQNYVVAHPYYGSFYRYYDVVYRQVYSPDYLREDKKVRIETTFYATTPPDGELIWTGVSDTFNPSSAQKVIKSLVKLVVDEMQKQGVL